MGEGGFWEGGIAGDRGDRGESQAMPLPESVA